MNELKWDILTKDLTGEYGKTACEWRDQGHRQMALNFFKSLELDSKDKTFYDIGCFNNQMKDKILSKWQGYDIIGDGNITQADAHELPIEDNVADIVFTSHMLEHTLAPIICVNELKRICKSKGDVIISVPRDPHHMGDDHNYVFTSQGWELLIRRVGLNLIKRQEEGSVVHFHCKKK